MIELYHVSKIYDRQITALSDINLKVEKGEFVFITGPSGAGKTTLLKLLFCAERPSSGQILIAGRNITRVRAKDIPYLRRQIGVVFQDFKLINYWTVYENVSFVLEILGYSRKEIRRRVLQTLKRVQLHHRLDFYPQKLSGGEQQRVAIARALVNQPQILLADEPTGNLDPDITEEIMNLFLEINDRGTTVLLASHDRNLIQRYSRRVISLNKGNLVGDNRTGAGESGLGRIW